MDDGMLMELMTKGLAALGALYALARVIVAMTPTPRDDRWLAAVGGWVIGLSKIFGLDPKQGRNLKMFAALLLAAVLFSGCSTVQTVKEAPSDARLVASIQLFTATVDSLADLREQGAFTVVQAERITMVIGQTQRYLQAWADASAEGERTPMAAVHVGEMLQKLIMFEVQARLYDDGGE